MTKTSLYRHFDKDGRLLYVGISHSFMARLSRHASASHWYWDIATVSVEHHRSRDHALYAEALAIRDENPIHNVVRPVPLDPDATTILPYSEPRLLNLAEKKLIAKAKSKCVEPVSDGPCRRLGYIRRSRDNLILGVRDLRRAGVPDELMFIDVVDYGGADYPSFVKIIKMAQHKGTTIVCDYHEEFSEALPILNERGIKLLAI